jgi:hypothetical protein
MRPASRSTEGDDTAGLGDAWTQPPRDLAPESASLQQVLLAAISTHNRVPGAAPQRGAPQRAVPPAASPDTDLDSVTADAPPPARAGQPRDRKDAAEGSAQAAKPSQIQLTGRRMASAELLARLAGRSLQIQRSEDATRAQMSSRQPSAVDPDALQSRFQPAAAPQTSSGASAAIESEAPDRLAHPMGALLRPLRLHGANRASLLPSSGPAQPGARPEAALSEDLDVLAAKIKQILDEEARRHGIDV